MSLYLSEQQIDSLKKLVLLDQIGFLCEELGDPGRYFPYLRSKRMLDSEDCQTIRNQPSFKDQVQVLVGLLKDRQSSKREHAFDVLVDALKKQRVQAHIARALLKALTKAKDEAITPNGIQIRNSEVPEQETGKLSSLQYNTLPSEDFNGSESFDIHPVHGALPPHPTDHSITMVYDDQSENIHPQHGLLPTEGEGNTYAQQESGLKAVGSAYNSGSESELGGQSQPSSMLTVSSHADSTSSSQTNTHGPMSTFSEQNDSMEVLKFQTKIKDLTVLLEEAEAEIKKKDAEIISLHQLLKKAGIEKTMDGYRTQPIRPYKFNNNGSDQHRTIATPSYMHYQPTLSGSPKPISGELQEQPQGWRENTSKSFSNNHFISRSKSSSPSASISFV